MWQHKEALFKIGGTHFKPGQFTRIKETNKTSTTTDNFNENRPITPNTLRYYKKLEDGNMKT